MPCGCQADLKRIESGWWGGRRLEAVRAVFHQSVWKVYGNRTEADKSGQPPDSRKQSGQKSGRLKKIFKKIIDPAGLSGRIGVPDWRVAVGGCPSALLFMGLIFF